jgi:UDP-3-O-[3-hydroxymyristoyl] glucosamine N-acyltransferase
MPLPKRLGELAALVRGDLTGDPERMISGVADLRSAGKDQLSFLANTKYAAAAQATGAGAILADRKAAAAFSCDVIRVDNPSAAFAVVADLFAPPPVSWPPGIDPKASVDPSATIGPGASIGPCAVIEAGAVIGAGTRVGAGCYVGHETAVGENCLLYPNVTIRERCVVGNRVILHPGAVIGSDGFGYEFEKEKGRFAKIPQTGYVRIDDDAEIGACTTIDRGRFDKTWIQQGAKIDNLVMIAHNVVVGAHSIIVAQSGLSGSSSTGSYVTLAGQVGTVGHIHIADQATVTGRSAVTKDVPPKQVWRGAPAKPIKESMEIEALTQRLPELYKRLRQLEAELKQLRGGA